MGARGDPVSDGEQTATFGFDGGMWFSRRRREERLIGKGGDAASRWRRRTLAFAFGRVGAEQRRFAALWGSAPAPEERGRERGAGLVPWWFGLRGRSLAKRTSASRAGRFGGRGFRRTRSRNFERRDEAPPAPADRQQPDARAAHGCVVAARERSAERWFPAIEPEAARAIVDEIARHIADVHAVLVEVAENVRDRVPYLLRGRQRLEVIALAEHLAAPAPETVRALRDADPERAQALSQCTAMTRFAYEVNVIALHREVHYPHRLGRARDRAHDPSNRARRSQIRQAIDEPPRRMNREPRLVRRTRPMRHRRPSGALPSGTRARATPAVHTKRELSIGAHSYLFRAHIIFADVPPALSSILRRFVARWRTSRRPADIAGCPRDGPGANPRGLGGASHFVGGRPVFAFSCSGSSDRSRVSVARVLLRGITPPLAPPARAGGERTRTDPHREPGTKRPLPTMATMERVTREGRRARPDPRARDTTGEHDHETRPPSTSALSKKRQLLPCLMHVLTRAQRRPPDFRTAMVV
jgi:hypothetical protein